MSINITGVRETERKFREIAESMTYEEFIDITGEAAEIVFNEVKKNVDRFRGPTGNLSKSVVKRNLKKTNKSLATSIVAMDRKVARHAHWLEYGTAQRQQATTGRSTGTMPAQPFFRPAVDSKLSEAAELIRQRLTEKARGW